MILTYELSQDKILVDNGFEVNSFSPTFHTRYDSQAKTKIYEIVSSLSGNTSTCFEDEVTIDCNIYINYETTLKILQLILKCVNDYKESRFLISTISDRSLRKDLLKCLEK